MAKNDEANVKIGADVSGLIDKIDESKNHLRSAAEGMTGDLAALSEAFKGFGIAALAVGAAGLAAGEGLKFVGESVKETDELARSFQGLQFQTGESLHKLNEYNAAMQMSGGDIKELQGWMGGATRAMKANADMLVANGIAANKAELMSMPFVEYLKRVLEATESIQDPGKRLIFLQETLGRSGINSASDIRQFIEALEDGKAALSKYGDVIDQHAIDRMEAMEHKMGELSVATQKLKADISESASAWTLAWAQAKVGFLDFVSAMMKGQLVQRDSYDIQLESMEEEREAIRQRGQSTEAIDREIAARKRLLSAQVEGLEAQRKEMEAALMKLPGAEAKKEEERPKKKAKTKEELAEAAEINNLLAAGVRQRIFTELDLEKDKAAKLVAIGEKTRAEELAADKALDMKREAAEVAALEKQKQNALLTVAQRKAIDNQIAAAHQQHKLAQQKLDNDIEVETYNESKRNAQKKMDDEIALSKFTYDDKVSRINQLRSMMLISEEEEIAMKRKAASEAADAEVAALEKELLAYKHTKQEEEEIDRRIAAVRRKNIQDNNKLTEQAAKHSVEKWKGANEAIASGFTNLLEGYMMGTEKNLNVVDALFKSLYASLVSYGASWLKEELVNLLTKKTAEKAGAVGAITANAGVAATAAMASVAAIPVTGWAMAPGVGAETFATAMGYMGTLASAAGGWGEIPHDQLAMVHKKEMILPAPIAQTVRDMASAPSAQQAPAPPPVVHNNNYAYTIHAMDGADVERVLMRHRNSLAKATRSAIRDGKTGR